MIMYWIKKWKFSGTMITELYKVQLLVCKRMSVFCLFKQYRGCKVFRQVSNNLVF